jgi:hypothetical protein
VLIPTTRARESTGGPAQLPGVEHQRQHHLFEASNRKGHDARHRLGSHDQRVFFDVALDRERIV